MNKPHQLDYARHLPAQEVRTGAGDAAVALLVMAATIAINAGLIVWLLVDLEPRLATAASGLTAILIGAELAASILWSFLLAAAAKRFRQSEETGGKTLVRYWRGKTILALIAFGLNAGGGVFGLPGDKTLGMCIWASALAGMMVTGLLAMGYRKT